MRHVLARQVPSVEVVNGEAERLPTRDHSIDAIVVGQAFHWFHGAAALREIARVLRPGGGLALLWNVQVALDPPWPARLTEVIEGHSDRDVVRSLARDLAPSSCEITFRTDLYWTRRVA